MHILQKITKKSKAGFKQLAVLADPAKSTGDTLRDFTEIAEVAKADYVFIGGSLLTSDNLSYCIDQIKNRTKLPVILFPGSVFQINCKADALLFLSLISGRNPDMLIGNHVIAANLIRSSGLETIPTGYMLIDSGRTSSVQYISNTMPIPGDKDEIAVATAIAGEMLGLQIIFMDAGSGAPNPVPLQMISNVKQNIKLPLIVGGGISRPELAYEAWTAGADIVTIGNVAESQPEIILEMGLAKKEANGSYKEEF
ncbi:MAG TPA: geranylgeranylglyceryl/heptaprenylglyceryl phosphate synthase [Bacteroidales bacterium]|nr:geranylgeranylglyceryl/heptaprenylglyceryl phosphate synthase [Bacteroidales bacterium]